MKHPSAILATTLFGEYLVPGSINLPKCTTVLNMLDNDTGGREDSLYSSIGVTVTNGAYQVAKTVRIASEFGKI
jgi:hypothetical protein